MNIHVFLPKKVSVSLVFKMIFRSSWKSAFAINQFMSPGVYLFIPTNIFYFLCARHCSRVQDYAGEHIYLLGAYILVKGK